MSLSSQGRLRPRSEKQVGLGLTQVCIPTLTTLQSAADLPEPQVLTYQGGWPTDLVPQRQLVRASMHVHRALSTDRASRPQTLLSLPWPAPHLCPPWPGCAALRRVLRRGVSRAPWSRGVWLLLSVHLHPQTSLMASAWLTPPCSR